MKYQKTQYYLQDLYLGTGEGSQGSNPQSCSVCPQVADRRSLLDGEVVM